MTGGGEYSPRPDSLFFELMDFTYTLSVQHNLSPFAIMEEDKDRVIMLINYFVEKGNKVVPKTVSAKNAPTKKSRYDGFWDF